MMELTKIDYPNKQKGGIQKNVVNLNVKQIPTKTTWEKTDRKQCSICAKLGKPGRFHNERDCYNREHNDNSDKNIKMNTELETELNKSLKLN